jgi:hypothetical protein
MKNKPKRWKVWVLMTLEMEEEALILKLLPRRRRLIRREVVETQRK